MFVDFFILIFFGSHKGIFLDYIGRSSSKLFEGCLGTGLGSWECVLLKEPP